jgi:hypothetical protein
MAMHTSVISASSPILFSLTAPCLRTAGRPSPSTQRHEDASPVDCVRVRAMFRPGSRVPMQSGSDRATRGPSERRVQSTRRSIGGATFCLPTLQFAHGSMTTPQRNVLERPTDRRVTPRLSHGRVRSWTGRSAVACATDSQLSRLTTAGTRVTRVSALRLVPVRAGRFARHRATPATGRALPLRRMDSGPPITSG